MKYFNNITTFEQAKQRYRILAKQLHPDKGGSATEFQLMQSEYKMVLLNLQQKQTVQRNTDNELLSELGKLAKVLIKKQVPQQFLKQRANKSKSVLEKGIYNEIAKFLDGFK